MPPPVATINQTLAPPAAAVLANSVAEAARRSHAQTTPLHVAAALIAAPSSLLRQAFIQSRPSSSDPVSCRAIELCLSVALDRLPTSTSGKPPVSNALIAAIKRAQANQRRGYTDLQQQQQLAVKVELEQLLLSILDDPSVSRVVREAHFSSPAVKSIIKQSLTSPPTTSNPRLHNQPTAANVYVNSRLCNPPVAPITTNVHVNHRLCNPPAAVAVVPITANVSVNPRLHNQQAVPAVGITLSGNDEAKGVLNTMVRQKRRNPIMVGDADPAPMMREVLNRIQSGDAPPKLHGAEVIDFGKEVTSNSNQCQITNKIKELGSRIDARSGGNHGRGVVVDLGDLKWLVEIGSDTGGTVVVEIGKLIRRSSVWLLGTATCASYLQCQVHHPAMEKDWDLHMVPIAARSPPPSLLKRIGVASSSIRKPTMCANCTDSYEHELAALVAKEVEKSSTIPNPEAGKNLPHWLQTRRSPAEQSQLLWKQNTEELLKRWRDTCCRLHPDLHQTLLGNRQTRLQLDSSEGEGPSPSTTLMRTDLVPSHTGLVKYTTGCPQNEFSSFKGLFKGLREKVGWQPEAAAAIATAVTRCKSGNGKPGSRVDTWLLFVGPDAVGKRMMATAMSELVFGTAPVTVKLDGEAEIRRRMAIDQVSEAVRGNPFSVVVLDGFDGADMLVRRAIKQAIESGRLVDYQGRQVSLGSVIFVITTDGSPQQLETSHCPIEERIKNSTDFGWQLELSISETTGKRSAAWSVRSDDQSTKLRKLVVPRTLSLDLNLSAGEEEDDVNDDTGDEGSRNSDLTVELGHERRLAISFTDASPATELRGILDAAIDFKAVDFGPIKRKVLESISTKFSTVFGNEGRIEVDEDAINWIVSGVWLAGATDDDRFKDWADRELVPSIRQLKSNLKTSNGKVVVKISAMAGVPQHWKASNWLPETVRIARDSR